MINHILECIPFYHTIFSHQIRTRTYFERLNIHHKLFTRTLIVCFFVLTIDKYN